jgi:Zn-dependent protease
MEINYIISLVIILILSAAFHEYMHGFVADRLGDPTAKLAGRLTLNPIVHLDFFGSLIIPLLFIVSGASFVFGWAKPVPYNPYNLRDQKYGSAKVALAGPAANFILAFILALAWRFIPIEADGFVFFMSSAIYINLLLMVFNLIPIPPLDGSKILAAFLPRELANRYLSFGRYGFFLILLFIFFAFQLILPIVFILFNLLTFGMF